MTGRFTQGQSQIPTVVSKEGPKGLWPRRLISQLSFPLSLSSNQTGALCNTRMHGTLRPQALGDPHGCLPHLLQVIHGSHLSETFLSGRSL